MAENNTFNFDLDAPATPTLTLDPVEEAAPAEEKKPEPAPAPEEVKLTAEEKAMVDAFAQKIDITNSQQVLQYGSACQKKIGDFSEAVQGIELLLDIGQHGVHVVLPGVERHLVFHHMGRTEFLPQAKRHGSAAQRHQQCPEFVHREHRAEHHEHQSACVKRQDTGFPGADDLAHEASPFPGHSRNLAPFLSIIKLFGKNASV